MSLKTRRVDLEPLETSVPYDVCIIGSGFNGSMLATSLVEKGVRVIMLESGKSLIRWVVGKRLKDLALYESCGDTEYPTTKTKARALGGNSNFWTGRTERLRPSDFENNSYTPVGASWPVTYAEMDPYYERAENTLMVRGAPLSDHYPPRLNGGQLRPGKNISPLKDMMAEIGVTVDNSPTATPDKGWRTYRVNTELMPKIKASAQATLVSGVTVTNLMHDTEGNITGVTAQSLDGQTKEVKARLYVVACGGIETPRLLLLSKSESFPNGIGNTHDQVGRGFNEHPGINFYGRIKHRKGTILPSYRLGRSHQFYDEFKSDGLGGVLPVFIQSFVFPNHLVTYKASEIPERIKSILGRIKMAEFYIGASVEMEPVDQNRVTLSDTARDEFGNPLARLTLNFTERDLSTFDRTRDLIRSMFDRLGASNVRETGITWSRHHIGTCRMGDNPRTSVVDRNLKLHDSPNLYLGGCETFVTGGAVPPVLTITALAHRLSDHLIERLKG